MKYIISTISAVIAVFVVLCAGSILENVPADSIVAIQAPISGKITWYTEPGLVFQWFGKVTSFPKRFQYWFNDNTQDGDKKGEVDNSLKIRFNDGGHAWLSGCVSCEMPMDREKLTEILMKFGNFTNLQNDLIRPCYEKSIYMTGPLMSSKESYAEKRSLLLSYIEDQAARGVYATKQTDVREVDPLTGVEKTKTIVEIQENKTNGQKLRVEESPLQWFSLRTFNLSINSVNYDDAVDKQIQQQQDAIMQVQTAIANSKRAEQDALTVAKQGEATAAKAKWEQETIKAKFVTEAEQKRDVAKLDKEAAEYTKAKLILEGEGEAKKRQLIMEADGALSVKVEAYKYAIDKLSAAIEKHPLVPQFVMGGGVGSNSANTAADMVNLLTLKTARDLALDIAPKK